MKRFIASFSVILACAALIFSCKKEEDMTDQNILAKRYLDAWLTVNYPEAQKTGLGIYIIDDIPGTGAEVTDKVLDDEFVFVDYTNYTLDMNVSATTDKTLAQQTGDYKDNAYYGQVAWSTSKKKMEAGIREGIKGMKVGGTRTFVIPGWLNVIRSYKNEEEYMKYGNGSPAIYKVTLHDVNEDIMKWEVEQLEKFVKAEMGGIDSTEYGVYYKTIVEPVDTAKIARDSVIYIDYVGRLLNGTVFDTTIADSAKAHGIWKEGRSYTPTKMTLNENYEEIKMGDSESSTVTGFSYGVSKLRRFETARCAFISLYGYSSQGSSPSIPAYSPLVFDLFVVDKP